VSLEKPPAERQLLTPLQRYTLTVESVAAVTEAHRRLRECSDELGITELGEIREGGSTLSFFLSDLDRNWWEISSPAEL